MNMTTDKAHVTMGQLYLHYKESLPKIPLKIRERKIPIRIFPSPFSENPYNILYIKWILSQKGFLDSQINPQYIGVNHITETLNIIIWGNFLEKVNHITETLNIIIWGNFLENKRDSINKILMQLNNQFFDKSLIGDWDLNPGYPGLGLFSFSIKNPHNIIEGTYPMEEVIYTLILRPT